MKFDKAEAKTILGYLALVAAGGTALLAGDIVGAISALAPVIGG